MRQAAALSIVSKPIRAAISPASRRGAGKRIRAPLPKITSCGCQLDQPVEMSGFQFVETGDRPVLHVAAPRNDHAGGVLGAVDDDAVGAVAGNGVGSVDAVGLQLQGGFESVGGLPRVRRPGPGDPRRARRNGRMVKL